MRVFIGLSICLTFGFSTYASDMTRVFAEEAGLIAGEAEHFSSQEKTEVRKWYLTTSEQTPDIKPDGDENHADGASGGAYLEVLPDTRRTHDDELIRGENFSNEPGKMAILSYPISVDNPGRYYVWVRTYSTTTEGNGLHVGLNGEWPESGQRMQWCEGKNTWRWESRQRTEENHCGERYQIYLDIEKAGSHTLQFSMREDGFEFDKWVLTTDRDYVPSAQWPEPDIIMLPPKN